MKKLPSADFATQESWTVFKQQYHLSEQQTKQFEQFVQALCSWNEVMNLTAITDHDAIIRDHLADSLAVTHFVTFSPVDSLCDVGTGAGFPGIPLKIMFPTMPITLLEVNQKKIRFLTTIIQELKLEKIEVCSLDFRTFIRKSTIPITYFCARASLRPDELVRLFKADSVFKSSTLIYWASKQFQLSGVEKPYFLKEETYTLDHNKERKLFFFTHACVAARV